MKIYEVKKESTMFSLYQVDRQERLNKHPKGFGWRIDMIGGNGRVTELPWQLDFKSKFLNTLINIWPFKGIVNDFFLDDSGNLCIQFEEYLAYDRPFYPFNLDKESEWLAIFDMKKRRWQLRRLRFLE